MDVDEGDLFSVVFAGRSGHSLLHSLTNPASARPSQPQSHYGVSSFSADSGLNCSRNAFTPVPHSFPCRTSSSSSNLFNIPPFLLDNPTYVKLENPSPSQSSIIDSVKIISGNNNKLPVRTECLPSLPCKRAGLNAPPTKQQSSKRRKEQTKRIVCVPASSSSGANSTEFLPSDMWSWRKYGQKPIKGSPYPRSYYRCSSSKGCPARKQVERSRNDSAKLIMTYMSEHNHAWPTHRNALAGSIRHPEGNLTCPSLEQAGSSPPLPPPDDSHIHDDASHTHDDEDNDNDDEDDADADDVHEHDHDHHDQHSIDMELQMLKYATEHFTGDDFLTFPTDLVNQS